MRKGALEMLVVIIMETLDTGSWKRLGTLGLREHRVTLTLMYETIHTYKRGGLTALENNTCITFPECLHFSKLAPYVLANP